MRSRTHAVAPLAPTPPQLRDVLTLVSERTGADFRGQRRAMLERRIVNHMVTCAAASPEAYLETLRADDAVVWALLERLTIKVSRFFRNPPVFEALRHAVVPALRRERGSAPLRAWSAGCARGQEAYSLAMLLQEVGGPWSVLATDVDPASLAAARTGTFGVADAADVPAELAARHLAPLEDGRLAVDAGVASGVRFGAHDVTSPRGLPEGRFDLVCCRNVLIYFVPEAQARIFALLLGRLAPGGYLCLGEAEWPGDRLVRELELVDRALRIFRAPADPGRRGGARA